MNHARFWVLLLAFGHAIAFAQSAELNGRVRIPPGWGARLFPGDVTFCYVRLRRVLGFA